MANLIQKIHDAKSFPKKQHAKIIWLKSPIKNQPIKLYRIEQPHQYQYQFCGFDIDQNSLHGIQAEQKTTHQLTQLIQDHPTLFKAWDISNDHFKFIAKLNLHQNPQQLYQNLIMIAQIYHQSY